MICLSKIKENYIGKSNEEKKNLLVGYIGIIILTIAQMNSVSALYEGTNEIQSGLDYISSWKIINNITWINATKISNTSIQITIPELAENISFSIVFEGYKNEEERIIYVPSGGGSSTKYIYKNNTVYQDKNVYRDRNITQIVNNTITITNKEEVEKVPLSVWIAGAILLILLLVLLRLYIKEKDNNYKGLFELMKEN